MPMSDDDAGEILSNPANVEARREDVEGLLQEYGVTTGPFHMELYSRAFTHTSYVRRAGVDETEVPDCVPLRGKSNERLEFLGDGVLELVTKDYLFRRFPSADEGFMTEKKISIVRNDHIGHLAKKMGLAKFVLLSASAEEKGVRTNLKKLGCAFEAFVGAVYVDHCIGESNGEDEAAYDVGEGARAARKLLEAVFERLIDWTTLISTDDNYKNQLQVLLQKRFKTTPDYLQLGHTQAQGYRMGVFLRVNRPLHKLTVESSLKLRDVGASLDDIAQRLDADGGGNVLLGVASHKVKRKAEQSACRAVLDILESASKHA